MHAAAVSPAIAPPGRAPTAAGPRIVPVVADPPWHDVVDSDLVAALAAGEMAALDQLYRRYRPACYAAAFALLREPAAADDAVHDAFLRAWRSASAFHPARGTVRAWLLTIVRHVAVDALRAGQVAARTQPRLAQRALADNGDDLPALVAAAGEATRLHAALRALPRPQQDALELAYFGGFSHGEIAARTGVPLGTVKGRVRLGLRRLRRELGDLAAERCAPAPRPLAAA